MRNTASHLPLILCFSFSLLSPCILLPHFSSSLTRWTLCPFVCPQAKVFFLWWEEKLTDLERGRLSPASPSSWGGGAPPSPSCMAWAMFALASSAATWAPARTILFQCVFLPDLMISYVVCLCFSVTSSMSSRVSEYRAWPSPLPSGPPQHAIQADMYYMSFHMRW